MSLWARVELKQTDGFQNSYRCKVVLECCPELQEAIARKLKVGSTKFCEARNDIHERQHRMHASLSANFGVNFFPIYRFFELMEAEGYQWVSCPSAPDREVHMFRKFVD